MGNYDKRMTFARRISERREMSSKAASQNFHSFLCTHIKIPCMLFLFPFQRKPVASLQKAQGSSPVSPNKPKKSSIRGREQCYQRPRVARTAAASSATRGRESMTCHSYWGDFAASVHKKPAARKIFRYSEPQASYKI